MARTRLEQAPQLSLFDVRPPAGVATGRRHELGDGSWVDHFPGWLDEPDALFVALAEHAPWEQRSRWMFTNLVVEPRLTAEFESLTAPNIAELPRVAERISKHYDLIFDGAWANLYRNHEDGTGWHADRPANRLETAIVPVLSLGATRRFLLRPRAGGRSTVFHVASGDLVVMGGRCQRDWVHMVPKETQRTGARISVNFKSRRQLAGVP